MSHYHRHFVFSVSQTTLSSFSKLVPLAMASSHSLHHHFLLLLSLAFTVAYGQYSIDCNGYAQATIDINETMKGTFHWNWFDFTVTSNQYWIFAEASKHGPKAYTLAHKPMEIL